MSAPDPSVCVLTPVHLTPEKAAPAARDVQGRPLCDNLEGPASSFARKTAALRKALIEAVTESDLRKIAVLLRHRIRRAWARKRRAPSVNNEAAKPQCRQ
jgi:hypothetical protein